MNYTTLRQVLIKKAAEYAANLPQQGRHYRSRGRDRVVLFPPFVLNTGEPFHGNFFQPSYQELCGHLEWRRRLRAPHAGRKYLPHPYRHTACDVDSCTSSAAILLSVFGSDAARRAILGPLFGFAGNPNVEFEFPACLAWINGQVEPRSTRIDVRIDDRDRSVVSVVIPLHIEAKLAEADFSKKAADCVQNYARLHEVFDIERLRQGAKYKHYQLIRNVLAAVQHKCRFCLLFDARRDDLLTAWNEVMAAVLEESVRARCFTRTWQSVAALVPPQLSQYLKEKYSIVADDL